MFSAPRRAALFASGRNHDTLMFTHKQHQDIVTSMTENGRNLPITVRATPGLIDRLDAWRRLQPDLPTRPEAVRRLTEAGLAAENRRQTKEKADG